MSQLREINVPDIGGHSHVEVIELLITVGQTVAVDDSLITLETDKATMEVPSPVAGVVREILIQVGSRVSAGDVIARLEQLVEVTTTLAAVPAPVDQVIPNTSRQLSAPLPVEPEAAHAASASGTVDANTISRAHAGPSARRLARELGVDLAQVQGSGRKGRIIEQNIKSFVKGVVLGTAPAPTRAPSNGLELLPWPKVDFAKFGVIDSQPLSRIQKISGANLARNWAMIPHVTQFDEADITEMEAFRQSMSEEMKANGVKLTPLAFLIKACVAALKQFPRFNASLDGDNLIVKRYFHIGFAADTPNGLVVPVVRDADKKSVVQIAQESAALAKNARDQKLLPADMQGGCFSLSSLGGIGGTAFTPIINAPEVAILGISKSLIKPVWNGSEFVPRLMLPLSLSYDHRVIDGAAAARFTHYLAQVLADIRRLLL